ncbi:MAG: tRNA 2-thiouridine(34) synthase MnmA [Pseudomonadota bacterium]|nr:tRNA 2-thiouridine(34) synthase MnmA [Pseudomonadota bacterium]
MKFSLPNKASADTRVVVAMSGGVDSSVTAALLVKEGYEVIGVTLQLYNSTNSLKRKGACCAGQDIEDARNVAEKLKIPHYVLNYESKFQKDVIDEFADAYVRGETPIPCVLCNQTVKFRDLLLVAQELGAEALATGHYVRRVKKGNDIELHRAEDETKDQSYFLFATTPKQLEFLSFPLGSMRKDETRRLAAQFSLPVSDKPDSQDICFVSEGSYASLINKIRPNVAKPGDIVEQTGRIIGTHKGITHFTIGQRRGLNLRNENMPMYVIKIDPDRNRVVVGPWDALATSTMVLANVNWLGNPINYGKTMRCEVKVRSMKPPVEAKIKFQSKDKVSVTLITPENGVAPGQACVFYKGTRLLGGGWIQRPNTKILAA